MIVTDSIEVNDSVHFYLLAYDSVSQVAISRRTYNFRAISIVKAESVGYSYNDTQKALEWIVPCGEDGDGSFSRLRRTFTHRERRSGYSMSTCFGFGIGWGESMSKI